MAMTGAPLTRFRAIGRWLGHLRRDLKYLVGSWGALDAFFGKIFSVWRAFDANFMSGAPMARFCLSGASLALFRRENCIYWKPGARSARI